MSERMTALEEIIETCTGFARTTPESQNLARAELAALRARVEQAERERDELKSLLSDIREARARVSELEADQAALEKAARHGGAWCTCELCLLRSTVAYPSEPATLTPRRCRQCAREATRTMREMSADIVRMYPLNTNDAEGMLASDLYDWISGRDNAMADAIRVMPLHDCGDCNPLKPELKDE